MTLDIGVLLQLLFGILLGVVGYMVRQTLERLDSLEKAFAGNTGRLIRIETSLKLSSHDDP